MYTFPTLLKKIRDSAGLTQEQLAEALDVSTVLISMVETGQKEASKNLVIRLAEKLEVRPSSILPFVFEDEDGKQHSLSRVEKTLISVGERLQEHLIDVKAKKLKLYARQKSLS